MMTYSGGTPPPENVIIYTEKYPAGAKVQVYYDPANPENATIEPGAVRGDWIVFAIGLASTLVGVGAVLLYISGRSSPAESRAGCLGIAGGAVARPVRELRIIAGGREAKGDVSDQGNPVAGNLEPRKEMGKAVHVDDIEQQTEYGADEQRSPHAPPRDRHRKDETAYDRQREVHDARRDESEPIEADRRRQDRAPKENGRGEANVSIKNRGQHVPERPPQY